jgi:translation initiation factor 2B subunit (eIF-2B alpha/beta/delta family)
MNATEKRNLDQLFRFHGNVLGAARTTVLALNSLIRAFAQLNCNKESMIERYDELAAAIRTTQPRIVPLIHMLQQFEGQIRPYLEADVDVLRDAAIKTLQKNVALYESRVERVVSHGIDHVEDGDGIIVHSASSVVTNILLQARQVMLRDFSVIVLKIDRVRTPQVAHILDQADIPHMVIPAFNLCHYLDKANKILLGAVSISRDLKVVAPVGTSSTLSLCRYNNIKSHLFAPSFHFSHGLSDSQGIHREETDVASSRTTYLLTTHSHDLVDMDLIDVVVDEDGVIDAERLKVFTG